MSFAMTILACFLRVLILSLGTTTVLRYIYHSVISVTVMVYCAF